MNVAKEQFEDVGEKDANGNFEFYYSGEIFRFRFPGREFHARRYDDTPGKASILGVFDIPSRQWSAFANVPYDDPQFCEVALYLRDTIGADSVKALLISSGYVELEFGRISPSVSDGIESDDALHCFQCRAFIPANKRRCPNCGWTWL